MSKSLYEMTRDFEELKGFIEDGTIPAEDAVETIEAFELTIIQKSHNVTAFILNQESEIEQLKEAEKRMARRRKSLENAKERLREYLLANMMDNKIFEIECPEWKVKVAKCPPSVELIEGAEDLLAEEYLRVKVTKAADKKAIKKALQEGKEIAGAALITKTALRFL